MQTLRSLPVVGERLSGMAFRPSAELLLRVVVGALREEVLFRLAFQNYLALRLKLYGKRYWMAILIATLLWTIGHAGSLEPGWLKLAQVFPQGLALGYFLRRWGMGSCVLAHALFNVVMACLTPYLIRL